MALKKHREGGNHPPALQALGGDLCLLGDSFTEVKARRPITVTLPRLTYRLFYTMAKGNALIIYCSKYFYLNISYMV